MTEELTKTTLKGATMIVSAQGASRLITFIGNVLLVRSMNNDARPLGVSSTQLHLLYVTALALTRDGVRRACLRELPANVRLHDQDKWEVGAALSRAYALVGVLCVTPLVFWHFVTNPPKETEYSEYRTSLILVMTGSCLELLSEPMFVVAQNCSMYRLRSTIEAASSLSRVTIGLIASVIFGCKLSAFAWGYFATGVAIFATLSFGLAKESGEGFSFPIMRILLGGRPTFQTGDEVGKFTFLTTIQSGWKLGLSEGEKIVMIAMGTVASDRGAYAMAANLGSLAARLLLQPSEEAAFTLFGKLKQNLSAQNLLCILTRASIVFGLIFTCFGTQFTHLLVLLLYGRGWADSTETPYLLSWYCIFISVCAVNGITEAFVQAVADDKETKSFNFWLLICSLVFVSISTVLLPAMGTAALIAANCLVMTMRITRNINFAREFIGEQFLLMDMLPKPRTGMMFTFSLACNWMSKLYMYRSFSTISGAFMHVAIGTVLLLMCAFTVWRDDSELRMLVSGFAKSNAKKE